MTASKESRERVAELKGQIVRIWREDALKDGWTLSALYNENLIEREFKLEKDGWVVHALIRENMSDLHGWGPDRLSVEIPWLYDWDQLVRNLNVCMYCQKFSPSIVRIGFAGRCCPKCRQLHVSEVEFPGWAD